MSAVRRRIAFGFVNFFLVSGLLLAGASAQFTSTPSSLSFASTYIGMASANKTITIKNTGSASATISSITSTCPEFKLSSGTAPVTLAKSASTAFSMSFNPDSAKAFSCQYTLAVTGGTALNVGLSGTGLASNAVVTSTPTSLTYTSQAVGTASATQTVTISNTGTASLKLTGVTITPPTFAINAVTLPVTINANSSTTLKVSYSPALVTSETGALGLTFDHIPTQVVDLNGTGAVSASLVISNIATLPQATVSAAYQASLSAQSGTAPYTFVLQSGSTLPSGLTLSSAGLISGTVGSTVATGNKTFTIQVTDSASKTATKLFTLNVAKTTGSKCNNISFNIPKGTTPIIPLNDLATGSYQGEEGGLYPSGSNVRPASHDSDGVTFAKAVQALDSNGNPSPTGKYVMLLLGESTALDAMGQFLPLARNDPARNASLVIVDGAQGGATPGKLLTTTSAYFNTILNNYLPDQGVTAQQVVAVWMEDSNGLSTGSFPTDMTTMQSNYETVMNNLHTLFPNLTLLYFSSRIYAGYSNGVATIDPEPYAYESAFAVKNAINDQLNGATNLNYNVALGTVKAPWMSWGPYYWANGLLARSDGMVWTCQDVQADGTHPASPSGDLKVAGQVLNFFKTDDTTKPWFLHP
jgi:hypothetical protein